MSKVRFEVNCSHNWYVEKYSTVINYLFNFGTITVVQRTTPTQHSSVSEGARQVNEQSMQNSNRPMQTFLIYSNLSCVKLMAMTSMQQEAGRLNNFLSDSAIEQWIFLAIVQEVPMQIRTMEDCRLSIGSLPWFSYDGSSGSGHGVGHRDQERPSFIQIEFDISSLQVPPLNRKTTKIAGRLPLPPFFNIRIVPKVRVQVIFSIQYTIVHNFFWQQLSMIACSN